MRESSHAVKSSSRGQWHLTHRCRVGLLSLIVFIAQLPDSSPVQNRPGDPYGISVNVEVVVLHATVRNRHGVPVSGLGKEDFQVYEDGVLQQIETFSHDDMPVTVGLVVDSSGSMRAKLLEVIVAALAFVRSSNPADQMFVVHFNDNVSFSLPDETPFTSNLVQLKAALSKIAPIGMTALYDAIAAALEHLKTGTRDKRVLFVISDGGDNASKRKLADILAMAGQSDAIIYAMGLFDASDPEGNPGVLERLARSTGGEAFLPGSMTEVLPICESIARDIRNQYAITYVTTNKKQNGTYRAIQVKARTPGHALLKTRTRAGYYPTVKLPAERVNP
jgi:VWFA-related protein